MAKKTSEIQAPVPNPLYVHIDRSDGCHLVGQLHIKTKDPDVYGGFSARFKYADTWLRNGFPIDPMNLPLKSDWFYTESKHIKLGVIFDAAPDVWGRRVIDATGDFASDDERQVLLMGRGNGVGALLFADQPTLTRDSLPGLDALPLIERDLTAIHEAVHQVCLKTDPSQNQAADWLAGSWSMGGARAKAVVRDADNKIYIAKFSEPHDKYDRQRIECANLAMAKDIGLQVPDCRVLDTHLGSVFAMERFDRPPGMQRKHYLSAISLVSEVPQSKRLDSTRDQMIFSYARIAQIAAKISENPRQDVLEIYARMLLNVCIRNTDDHMKNTGFIEGKKGGGKLQLSPVFDVVTQPGGGLHYLTIGQHGRHGTIENALSEPERFGIKRPAAENIANRVKDVVAERDHYYRRVGLDAKTLDEVDQLVEVRCPRFKRPLGQ